MIIRNAIRSIRNETGKTYTLPELVESYGLVTSSGQVVTPETSRNVATAYRCMNILSDDIAKMPLQVFSRKVEGKIERIRPSYRMQNISWLLEKKPNRWMTPFKFKKKLILDLLNWGNGFAWFPQPGREIFILNSSQTRPYFDTSGNLWYRTVFSNGEEKFLPEVEVIHLLINAADGITGHSVISFARETLGRQMGAYETQGKFFAQGLNPGGIVWMDGEVDKKAREKVRGSFEEAMSGSKNAYRLAVLDNKVSKFESITVNPDDAQFLESMEANDVQIANFYGMPLFKLNMGKQAYNSNEQANLDYLSTTLDPYLVQSEEEFAAKLLSEQDQETTYLRFNRDVLLRTDAKTRTETIAKRITTGQLSPNEGRDIEDLSGYPEGDGFWMQSNVAKIGGSKNA